MWDCCWFAAHYPNKTWGRFHTLMLSRPVGVWYWYKCESLQGSLFDSSSASVVFPVVTTSAVTQDGDYSQHACRVIDLWDLHTAEQQEDCGHFIMLDLTRMYRHLHSLCTCIWEEITGWESSRRHRWRHQLSFTVSQLSVSYFQRTGAEKQPPAASSWWNDNLTNLQRKNVLKYFCTGSSWWLYEYYICESWVQNPFQFTAQTEKKEVRADGAQH